MPNSWPPSHKRSWDCCLGRQRVKRTCTAVWNLTKVLQKLLLKAHFITIKHERATRTDGRPTSPRETWKRSEGGPFREVLCVLKTGGVALFGTMLRICLQRAFRPALRKLPKAAGTARHAPSCWMGTHGRNEPLEPLNSPTRAKEFIYRLHPKERTCLLQELQIFESKALAQGKATSSVG